MPMHKRLTQNITIMEPIFKINSDWKTFNRQSNLIAAGCVWSNTQHSNHIRPWRENGDAGINFDLEYFERYRIPKQIEDYLRNHKRGKTVILYMFFTTTKHRHEPFLWVLTDNEHRLIYRQTVTGYRRQWWKRQSAADKIIPYITA